MQLYGEETLSSPLLEGDQPSVLHVSALGPVVAAQRILSSWLSWNVNPDGGCWRAVSKADWMESRCTCLFCRLVFCKGAGVAH